MDEKAFRGSINILSKHRGKSQVVAATLPRLFTFIAYVAFDKVLFLYTLVFS